MLDIKTFKSVPKKCPNIRGIGIHNRRLGFNDSNESIEFITNLCNNLVEIDFDFQLISVKNFDKFIAKFGQTIRKCDYYSGIYLEYKYYNI